MNWVAYQTSKLFVRSAGHLWDCLECWHTSARSSWLLPGLQEGCAIGGVRFLRLPPVSCVPAALWPITRHHSLGYPIKNPYFVVYSSVRCKECDRHICNNRVIVDEKASGDKSFSTVEMIPRIGDFRYLPCTYFRKI